MNSKKIVFAYHIDLKRAMWRLDYLADFIQRLKRWGFNAVVLEVEDKFRFSKHPAVVHPEAPTHAQWRAWAQSCRKLGMDVIPLVQTLGHLEFAINRPEYAHLREAPGMAEHVDVTNPASRPFVMDLLDEVIDVFEPKHFVHLGGDETWQLAKSPRLRPCLKHRGKLYLQHLLPIIANIRHRNLRPMLWHDMVVTHPEIMRQIPRDVLMVHWDYMIGALREKRTMIWGGQLPDGKGRGNIFVEWGTRYNKCVTPEFRKFLAAFAVDAQTRKDGTFPAFYCTTALQALGLDVVTASANRSAGDQSGIPLATRHTPNCYWSAKMGLSAASGNIVTSWAVRHNHPETNLASTYAAALAARGKPGDKVEIAYSAWAESVFGVAMPKFSGAVLLAEQGVDPLGRAGIWRNHLDSLLRDQDRFPQSLKEMVKSLGGTARAGAFLTRLRRGYALARKTFLLCRSRAKRNKNLLDFWIEGVDLQDFYAEFLQAAIAKTLGLRASALHKRLCVLVAATRVLFCRTYMRVSVENEILLRYGFHLEYLGRLLAAKAPFCKISLKDRSSVSEATKN